MSRRVSEVAKQARRVRALEERLAAARADRDAAIRDAAKGDDATVSAVAREAGLSRQSIYDILTGSQLDMSTQSTTLDSNTNR